MGCLLVKTIHIRTKRKKRGYPLFLRLVDLRRIELRSYKVQTGTLHA